MNKIFKVVWSKTKNCYVVASELAKRSGKCGSNLNKKVKCSVTLALLTMSIALPVHADFPADRYGENNLSSAAMTTYLNYTHGTDSDNGTYTFEISPQTASQLKTVTVGINGTSGFLPNSKIVLLQNSIVETLNGERNWGYYTYTGKFKYGDKTYTAKAIYDPENDKWTTTLLDEEGQPHPDIAIQPEGGNAGVTTNKDIRIEAGKVEKKSNGYFVTNTIKTKDQVTGKESVDVTTVQCGDVVTLNSSSNSTGQQRIEVAVNGGTANGGIEQSFDALHYFAFNDNNHKGWNYSSNSSPGVKPSAIYSLAIGVEANAAAALATVTGSYSITGQNALSTSYPTRGIGATVYGAANSINIGTASTAYKSDGAGNSVIGFGNTTTTSNGSLIWGTGNNVSNVHGEEFSESVKTAYETLKNTPASASSLTLKNNFNSLKSKVVDALKAEGGNVMVIGTGNSISSTRYSRAIGESNSVSYGKKVSVFGSGNTIQGSSNEEGEQVKDTIVLGDNNKINTAVADNIVIGNKHTVKTSNNIIIGSSADTQTTEVDNVVSLGYGASVTQAEGVALGVNSAVTLEDYASVALGSYSKADRLGGYEESGDDDVEIGNVKLSSSKFAGIGDEVVGTVSIGYVPEQKQKSRAANSDVKARTLTYVGAGEISKDSTDAINGSQLYAAIDAMQFNIVAGDNITVATETIDGIKTYTISSSNATAVKPGENVAVEGPTETAGAAGSQTDGGADASVDQGTYKTDNYIVNSADSKVTGVTVEAGESTTSGITTTTEYMVTVTSDEQKVVDGKIETEEVSKSGTFKVTDTNTQYELSGEKGKTNDNQTTPYTLKLKGTDESESTFEFKDTRNTVEAGDDTIVVESTENEDGSFKYTITSKAKSVSNVEVKAGSDNVIVTSEGDEDKKIYTVDVKTDGKVAAGDTGIVTGDTVYNETRIKKDGNYIKKDNTAADNLVALDEKVKDHDTKINNINNQFGDMDNRMRKGLAGAAALAALHPMDFNPDDKMQFSAGVGHYRGETAAAIGAFYRPDESVMFSIGGTFGNSDNMINAGITFGLDGTRNRITRSRTAMAREIQDLRSLVTQMAARMDRLEGANVETAMFPDVPENHWAYEYVEDLQKRGALKGYPDGLFKGDRAMTRYEFAAMLDRLVRGGVMLDSKIAKEFEPELGRIYVERISGQDNDRKKVERVRVNNSDSKYPEGKTRDVYGSKIVTEVPKAAETK